MPKVFQTENTDQQGKRFAHVEIILLLASTSFVVFILIEGEKNSSVTVLVLFGTKNSAVDFFATVQVAAVDFRTCSKLENFWSFFGTKSSAFGVHNKSKNLLLATSFVYFLLLGAAKNCFICYFAPNGPILSMTLKVCRKMLFWSFEV